jgi:HSP20 family protein
MLPVNKTLVPTVSRFLDDDWNKLFDWSSSASADHHSTVPPANIQETPEQFIIDVLVPGMNKEDFIIELNDDVLAIKAELNNDTAQSDAYIRREFNLTSFTRSFTFNKNVIDEVSISATYQDGVLRIVLPKRDEAKMKPARTIQIK